jgi:hypothetical protein
LRRTLCVLDKPASPPPRREMCVLDEPASSPTPVMCTYPSKKPGITSRCKMGVGNTFFAEMTHCGASKRSQEINTRVAPMSEALKYVRDSSLAGKKYQESDQK